MRCDEARDLAPEAALEVLDAELRAELLAHVAGCSACRRELADLSAGADALLLAVGPAEPAPGFEARVLDRVGVRPAAGWRRRQVVVPALAAAVVALVLVAGVAFRGSGGASSR